MNKQRKLIICLLIITSSIFTQFRKCQKDREYQKTYLDNHETTQKIIQDVLDFSQNKDRIYSETLKKLSTNLFTNLSENIRIDRIEYSDSIVKYLFILIEKPQITVDEFVAINKPELVNFLKEQHYFTTLLSDSIPFLYVYRDLDDKIFAEILITPEDSK